MFHWEPEGCYRHRLTCDSDSPLLVLNGTLFNSVNPLLALNRRYSKARRFWRCACVCWDKQLLSFLFADPIPSHHHPRHPHQPPHPRAHQIKDRQRPLSCSLYTSITPQTEWNGPAIIKPGSSTKGWSIISEGGGSTTSQGPAGWGIDSSPTGELLLQYKQTITVYQWCFICKIVLFAKLQNIISCSF